MVTKKAPKSTAKTTPVKEEVEITTLKAEEVVEVATPQVDMKSMMEQMKAELMEELREQAMAEAKAELAQTSEVEEISVPKKKVEIDRFEQIPVMNVTTHTLIYASKKTGAEWEWTGYGDIEYIEFQELITMKSAHKKFLDEPHIIIMDDDVVNYLGLTKMYNNIVDLENIERIFKLSQSEFEEILEKSPKGIKHTIISKLKQMADNEEDISHKKIKYVNDKFDLTIGQRG